VKALQRLLLTQSGHLAGASRTVAACFNAADQNSLTLIVSWLDFAKRFTLNLSMVFYQSNLSN
jgi:hypothetical protein